MYWVEDSEDDLLASGEESSEELPIIPTKRRRVDSSGPSGRSPVRVKRENDDSDLTALLAAISTEGLITAKSPCHVRAKLDKEDVAMTGTFVPPRKRHSVVKSASDIEYTPESAIREGKKRLRSIQDVMKLVPSQDTLRQTALKSEIETVNASGNTPKTVIAICGATGVGKSSLLNAVLGDKIVPSSGTGACTSVVTEIAYHGDDSIAARISFDTREDWLKEIRLIQEDIIQQHDDTDAIYEERTTKPPDSQSPAEIAWQKVHAAYPDLELEDLGRMNAENLIDSNRVLAEMLGTTKYIECDSSESFQEEIIPYIGSRSQNHCADPEDYAYGPIYEMWPLITKVVIYCNAKVLSTGARFVDLPGVADSNSARDNIAKEYLQNANHFWIVAPINRAISDKTARDLLGERFKMQLRDGNLWDHAITFIATKCDQLSCSEVIKEFNLRKDAEFQELEDRIKANGLEALKANLEDSKARRDDCIAHLKALRRGKTYVSKYAVKRPEAMSLHGSSSRDDVDVPPTVEILEKRLRRLRKAVDDATNRLVEHNPATSERERKAFCASRRSEYTRKVLKSDFRTGIAELDGKGGDTSKDYANINLPVFTCSSTDYLRLTGQSKDDGPSECFSKVGQTGIPNLRKWVHEITLSARQRGAMEFLSRLSTFTQSVAISARPTEDISDANKRALRVRWQTEEGKRKGASSQLNEGFTRAVEGFVQQISQKFRDGLVDKCKAGATQASKSSLRSLDQFSSFLYWSTYRAVLRRHGRFRNYDLNERLTRPMAATIFHSWPTLFESVTFDKLEEALLSHVDQFLSDFKESAPAGLDVRITPNGELCRDMVKTILPQIFSSAKGVLDRAQKRLSRSLDDHIAQRLHDAYVDSAGQRGKGSVHRQKAVMRHHLEKNKASIFNSAGNAILDGTDGAVRRVSDDLKKALAQLARKIEMDLSVLWEDVKKDAPHVRARQYLSGLAEEIQGENRLWQDVARLEERAQRSVMDQY